MVASLIRLFRLMNKWFGKISDAVADGSNRQLWSANPHRTQSIRAEKFVLQGKVHFSVSLSPRHSPLRLFDCGTVPPVATVATI